MFTTGSLVNSSPAVVNGIVYIGSQDHNLYAINALTGQQDWIYRTQGDIVLSSPAVVNGIVYIGSEDENLYAINANTGSFLWSFPTGGFVKSSPAVSNGVVYFSSWDDYIYAANATTGAQIWSYKTNDEVTSSPAVSNGAVYVGSLGGVIYAFGQPWPTISPTSVIMDLGQSQQFTTTVGQGGTPPYTYQWYVNGTAQSTTASTFNFAPNAVGTYLVYVSVTDASGFTAQSNTATVTINPATSLTILPTSITMDVGQSQIFNSTVSKGTTPYTYQWYLNGTQISGATSSSYTYVPASSGSATISLQVNDSATTPALTLPTTNSSITIKPALVSPTISATKSTIDQGQSTSLTSTAASGGTGQYTYQWLQQAPGATTYIPITGATSSVYSFSPTTSNITGAYGFELKVTDNATSSPATITSSAISVTVNSALVAPTASGPAAANQGQAFTLSSTNVATGTGPYTYQWFSEAPNANSYTAITNAISPAYNYITTTSTSLGTWNFIIQVNDAAGASINSSSVAIPVSTALTATAISSSTTTLIAGQGNTVLTTTTPTTGSSPYSYQWFEEAPNGVYTAVGSNSTTFTFAPASGSTAGTWNFMAQVTDASGAALNSTNTAITVTASTVTPTPTPTPTAHPTATPTTSPTASPTAKPTSSPTNSPTSSPTHNNQSSNNTYLYVIIIVIVLVVVAVIAFLMMRRNKAPKAKAKN